MGTMRLTECPLDFAGPEASALVEMAELFRKGLAPVAGGALDQAQKFLDAARFAWSEEANWRARKGLGGDREW